MKKSLLIILGIVLFTQINCCKDKNAVVQEDLGFFKLDTIKPYLYFKPGSYWVYQNDSTKQLDSIVMLSSLVNVLHTESKKRKYDYENITTFAHSYTNNYDYNLHSYGSSADMVDWDFHLLWERARSKSGDYDGVAFLFSTIQTPGKNFGFSTQFINKIPIYTLMNKTYYDVLKFEVKDDSSFPDSYIPTEDYGISNYYWAKDVGLIKIENLDADLRKNPVIPITQSWNLIRYLIIP